MRKYLFWIVVLGIYMGFLRSYDAFSQEVSVYNQYFFNPFLFNPAFVGNNGGTEINTVYRQQWLGFADAPVKGTLTVQHATKSNIKLGLTITHEDVVLLQRNAALITAGYRLPLGHEHSLSFGLSAGIGRYGLDLNQVDRTDPALKNSTNSTLYADGNFGFLYQIKNLKLSVAFNNIFDASPYSQENLNNIKFSNLNSFVGSLSYLVPFNNSPLSFEPYVIYRNFGPDVLQAEAAGVFYYKDKIWLGGAYRYKSNPAIFAGFDLFKNFKLSYAYELPPIDFNRIGQGSHELMLRYHFGRKKEVERSTQATAPDQYDRKSSIENKGNTTIEEVEPELEKTRSKQKNDPTNSISNKKVYVDDTTKTDPLSKEPIVLNDSIMEEKEDKNNFSTAEKEDVPKVTKGYYVVTGVFNYRKNAEKFIEQMADQGFLFKMAINPENSYYYVYKKYTDKLSEARYSRSLYLKIEQLSDTWIFEVE